MYVREIREVKKGWKLQRITVGKLGTGWIKTRESKIKTGFKKQVILTQIRINWLKIGYDFVQVVLNIFLATKTF
jgi:hypothetical protein